VALRVAYPDAISNAYQERMEADTTSTPDDHNTLAQKLLVDLLFYSGQGGARKLWMALIDRSL
jgi:hypothetical protein